MSAKRLIILLVVIYILAFLAAFTGSAVFKLKYDPSHGKYSVKWSKAVGTKLTDLPYGKGEANRFDLYLPAMPST